MHKVTPERIAEWSALLDEGYAYRHIAEMKKVSEKTLIKYLPGRGWTREQRVAQAALVKKLNRVR